MRDKNLLQVFLILNVALGGCFVVYLFLSSNSQPKVTSANFVKPLPKTNSAAKLLPPLVRTNMANVVTNSVAQGEGVTNAPALTNPPAARAVFQQKKIGWEQLEKDEQTRTEEYNTYLGSLRAVGCPEDKIRYIVMADINELFAKKRLKEAVAHDLEWWRSEPELAVAGALQEKGRTLEEQRRALVEKYLGSDAAEVEKGEAMLWSSVQLTGPVLGALPPEVHNAVQEICARSMERHQGAFWARINDGQPLNQVEMARLREQTRADLRKVLDPEAMEEFLLR
ncbi:MAG TPA: hypothetical protein VEO53_11340, partial [Candidatus Binatia bacterium]|nr:hypothetical protein [Candidatus Binatia bacterium]